MYAFMQAFAANLPRGDPTKSIKITLTGPENFSQWKTHMETFLQSQDLWHCTQKSLQQWVAEGGAAEIWHRHNATAYQKIIMSTGASLSEKLGSLPQIQRTGFHLWNKLTRDLEPSRDERVSELTQELLSL